MNLLQKRHERVNYRDNAEERRRLTVYLQAGYFQKISHSQEILTGSLQGRVILYCLAGISFLIGSYFIFF